MPEPKSFAETLIVILPLKTEFSDGDMTLISGGLLSMIKVLLVIPLKFPLSVALADILYIPRQKMNSD